MVLYLCIMAKKAKLPADTNKRAKAIVDLVTGDDNEVKEIDPIKAAAAALGRKGGLKGGVARAKKLTSKKRIEIARKAAAARWNKK
jgi:hypothetical protein